MERTPTEAPGLRRVLLVIALAMLLSFSPAPLPAALSAEPAAIVYVMPARRPRKRRRGVPVRIAFITRSESLTTI